MGYFISLLIISLLVGFVIYRFNENPENEKQNKKVKLALIGSVSGIVLVIGIVISAEAVRNIPSDNPSFYDTENIEDMNYEELEDYNEWLEKQDKKKQDNKKVYNN